MTKQRMASAKLVRTKVPERLCAIIVWIEAIATSHGMRDEFSTGSQPQYPPQPRVSYAQYPPRMIPVPRTAAPNTIQGFAIRIQVWYWAYETLGWRGYW